MSTNLEQEIRETDPKNTLEQITQDIIKQIKNHISNPKEEFYGIIIYNGPLVYFSGIIDNIISSFKMFYKNDTIRKKRDHTLHHKYNKVDKVLLLKIKQEIQKDKNSLYIIYDLTNYLFNILSTNTTEDEELMGLLKCFYLIDIDKMITLYTPHQ